jgi:hypothetical protein
MQECYHTCAEGYDDCGREYREQQLHYRPPEQEDSDGDQHNGRLGLLHSVRKGLTDNVHVRLLVTDVARTGRDVSRAAEVTVAICHGRFYDDLYR